MSNPKSAKPSTNGRSACPKRVRKSFKKRKDAEAELGKRVSLIAEKRYLDFKKECVTTLAELLKKYEENFGQQSSFKTAKHSFVKNFREYFGAKTLLSNIQYVDVETYRNHLRRKLTQHKSIRKDASINREMSCLRHMFKKAVTWDMAEASPFTNGETLMLKENNMRKVFLKHGDIVKLLSECPGYLQDIVECAINTGMRKGELLGLKWDQVRNDFIYLRETKMKEPRQIPINDDLDALFKRIKKAQQLTSREYIFNYWIDTKQGRKVERLRVNDVKVGFNAACKRAGIVNFRFHDLRHTFASHMVMAGAGLKDVQEILGHKTMTMTLRYAHLSNEHKKAAVNLITGLTAEKKLDCHKTVTHADLGKCDELQPIENIGAGARS